MSWWKILLIAAVAVGLGGAGIAWYFISYTGADIYVPMFADHCADCHGRDLDGTDAGVALVGRSLSRGDSVMALQDSIRNAHPELGQPAFANQLTDLEIKGLSIYVAERRLGQRFLEFQFDRDVVVPATVQNSEEHDFRVETVISGLDPLIFSIEPLADGSFLVTEKERGLSIVSADGRQSDLIEGTPATGSSMDVFGIQYGSGWRLDVALHPQQEENGWIYLHYTELCGEACGSGMVDASMNRLDRGRIVDGKWVDVETIWKAPIEFYASTPDTGAGGRIAFDDQGHVFISVGIKTEDGFSDSSPQDLTVPYGKIHRVNDDGTIPLDNPFVEDTSVAAGEPSFIRQTIWTYGHRSPQGLEWHPLRQRVWNSEMGPRGGDELNELLPGRNYGWPFFSLGLEYSGDAVERHKARAIEFDAAEIQQTLVDITPSPAISSFVVYEGDRFPGWKHDVLIGSLKGSSLFRMSFEGDQLTHRETVIKDLARIRDIEVGMDGLVYLLLENEAGSSIVRLLPETREPIARIR